MFFLTYAWRDASRLLVELCLSYLEVATLIRVANALAEHANVALPLHVSRALFFPSNRVPNPVLVGRQCRSVGLISPAKIGRWRHFSLV